MKNSTHHLTIPIELIRYVKTQRLERCFSVYLYLKINSDGVINAKDIPYEGICRDLHIKDRRTFKKHINKLISLDWVGFNPKTKNYFIRGFAFLKDKYGFKTRVGAICEKSNLRELKYFLPAAIIAFEIKRQKMIQSKVIRRNGGVTALKKQGAIQLPFPFFLRRYFGLSNEGLGKVLLCSKSEANRLKIKAGDLGFLVVKKRVELISKLDKPDFYLRGNSPDSCKIRFFKQKDGSIRVYKQLMDEIEPLIKMKITKR